MTSARVLWGLLVLTVLTTGLVGSYLSLRPAGQTGPAAPAASPRDGFVLRMHKSPRPLPEVYFEDRQGGKRNLSQFGGKVVLLNVWATWCTPCREEMPALDRLQQKLGGPDFEVLALSIDSAGAQVVKRFYEETGVRSLAIYVDPTMRATSTLGAVGIPTTLLIDQQGREVGRRTGPAEWDGPQAVRVIEDFLKEGKP